MLAHYKFRQWSNNIHCFLLNSSLTISKVMFAIFTPAEHKTMSSPVIALAGSRTSLLRSNG